MTWNIHRHIFQRKHKPGKQQGRQHHTHHGNQHGCLLGIGNVGNKQPKRQTGNDEQNAFSKQQ